VAHLYPRLDAMLAGEPLDFLINVTEEDNAMVLLDHGHGVIPHVQSGFNCFNPPGHDGSGG
jgi:hypothetical protein